VSRRARASLSAAVVALVAAGGLLPSAASPAPVARLGDDRPDKVVIIVVDSLSKEIVKKYDMDTVQALMKDGVDTPESYLGHTGAVTVVTHNVITSGMLPKNMGWTNEGYRDVGAVLNPAAPGGLYITSNFGRVEMSKLQEHAGYPQLSDYLDETGKVFTVSPKGYAAWGLGGPGSDNTSVTTFASGPSCNGVRWRMPDGHNVPAYIKGECGSRYWVRRDKIYDTGQLPAQLYPATDDRYVVGDTPNNEGGDIWAADAVLDIMEHEEDEWSGIFVSLPGVDKAAHMWGGVNDPEGATPGYVPMTHMEFATATADAQVGRIMDALEESGELDSTLVVLTADHGSVAAAEDHFHGELVAENDYGFFNWYYGDPANDIFYNRPQEALQPLIDTGNVGLTYSDSSLNVWLKDQAPDKVTEAAAIMETLPDVTAVWRRDGDHFDLVSEVRWDLMHGAEKLWFERKAQELVDTQAAAYGPDLIATLPDDTTYSVLGDHGGVQRATQQVPIVFTGGGVSHKDLRAEVRSVDIMPTILKAMGIEPTYDMDGIAYPLPTAGR
jgi:predicted AlkP superfamily pyrophosphatase or phosphodiesterase